MKRGDDRSFRAIALPPLLAWVGLCVILALTLGYAFIPGAPMKLLIGLIFASGKTTLIVLVFMQLGRASPLVKVTAMAGLVWLSLLYILSFSDMLTRT